MHLSFLYYCRSILPYKPHKVKGFWSYILPIIGLYLLTNFVSIFLYSFLDIRSLLSIMIFDNSANHNCHFCSCNWFLRSECSVTVSGNNPTGHSFTNMRNVFFIYHWYTLQAQKDGRKIILNRLPPIYKY